MKIIKEFKEFAMRGNVLDMAIGIIIGVAFGKIVSSLVNDVIMPPIGLLLGGVDFSKLAITLKAQTTESAAVTIKYGIFINTVLDFLIVAFAIFIVIKHRNYICIQYIRNRNINSIVQCSTVKLIWISKIDQHRFVRIVLSHFLHFVRRNYM